MKKLSAILQKKTGKSLAEAREKRILSVLGLAKANAEEDDCQLILDKLNEVIEELNAEYKAD